MFPSWWRDDDLLTVIDVGIDESKSGSMLVLSAIVGKTAQMRKLRKAWNEELHRLGVEYFHAKDHWNNRAKAYNGISREEREHLLRRLTLHLNHYFLFGASAIIDDQEHRLATSDRLRSQLGSAYGFAFQLLMTMVLLELREQGKDNQPINILIEDGHPNAQQAIEMIRAKKTRANANTLIVNSYGLGGKKGNSILQAADMLAYGVCEFHRKGSSPFTTSLVQASKHRQSRLLELPWSVSSVDAVKDDIVRNLKLRRSGVPGSKSLRELDMW